MFSAFHTRREEDYCRIRSILISWPVIIPHKDFFQSTEHLHKSINKLYKKIYELFVTRSRLDLWYIITNACLSTATKILVGNQRHKQMRFEKKNIVITKDEELQEEENICVSKTEKNIEIFIITRSAYTLMLNVTVENLKIKTDLIWISSEKDNDSAWHTRRRGFKGEPRVRRLMFTFALYRRRRDHARVLQSRSDPWWCAADRLRSPSTRGASTAPRCGAFIRAACL